MKTRTSARKRTREALHDQIACTYRKQICRSDTETVTKKNLEVNQAVLKAETHAWKQSKHKTDEAKYIQMISSFVEKIQTQEKEFQRIKTIGFVHGSGVDDLFISAYNDMKPLNAQKKMRFWYSRK